LDPERQLVGDNDRIAVLRIDNGGLAVAALRWI